MGELGNKITELRKQNNLTQKELGDKLNISAQAVSKWENNISQPDFDTVVRMTKIFNVSLSEFSGNEDLPKNNNEVENDTNTIICSVCYKKLSDEDIHCTKPTLICKSCNERFLKEQNEIKQNEAKNEESKFNIKRVSLKKSLIVSTIISVIIFSLFLLGLTSQLKSISTTEYIIISIILSLLSFTFVFQVRIEGLVNTVVTESIGRTITMPGIIFGLNIDSVIFTIAYKFVIAPLIVLGIALITFCGGCLIGIIISPFSFPFALTNQIKIIKEKI